MVATLLLLWGGCCQTTVPLPYAKLALFSEKPEERQGKARVTHRLRRNSGNCAVSGYTTVYCNPLRSSQATPKTMSLALPGTTVTQHSILSPVSTLVSCHCNPRSSFLPSAPAPPLPLHREPSRNSIKRRVQLRRHEWQHTAASVSIFIFVALVLSFGLTLLLQVLPYLKPLRVFSQQPAHCAHCARC